MKLLLIGGVVGLVIGVLLTVFYFSLATFFAVQAKALKATQEVQKMATKTLRTKSLDESAKATWHWPRGPISRKR